MHASPHSPSAQSFAVRIAAWQRRRGRRDLPWQGTRDAYRIWIAEIMLQQTQVAAVIGYYARFLQRFADVQSLAAAPLADVLAAWSGLGYYGRARNAHRCAQDIVAQHGGRFPRTAEALAQLPGIGRSTAAAIACFAFGERAAILDGNVKRVLARHFGVDGFPGAPAVERRLWALADTLLPTRNLEAYTQGLMDLGATVCTRARPQCGACPLDTTCVALREGRTAQLPEPRPQRVRPVRRTTVAVIRDARGAVLLEIRPPSGVWGGLASLPEFDVALGDAALRAAIRQRFALETHVRAGLPAQRHDFTHYRLWLEPRLLELADTAPAVAADAGRFVAAAELAAQPLPAPIRRLLRQLPRQDPLHHGGVTSEPSAASDTCGRSATASLNR